LPFNTQKSVRKQNTHLGTHENNRRLYAKISNTFEPRADPGGRLVRSPP